MTGTPRSAGSVFRKIVAVLVLVPLAVVIVAFAVANRQIITVSFDPFSAERPAASLTLPLFLLLFIILILGVVIGGFASWLRHGNGRRAARRLERDIAAFRQELTSLRRPAGREAKTPEPAAPAERLQLRPPLH